MDAPPVARHGPRRRQRPGLFPPAVRDVDVDADADVQRIVLLNPEIREFANEFKRRRPCDIQSETLKPTLPDRGAPEAQLVHRPPGVVGRDVPDPQDHGVVARQVDAQRGIRTFAQKAGDEFRKRRSPGTAFGPVPARPRRRFADRAGSPSASAPQAEARCGRCPAARGTSPRSSRSRPARQSIGCRCRRRRETRCARSAATFRRGTPPAESA